MVTHRLRLDVRKRLAGAMQLVVARRGDNGSQTIEAEIVSNGSAFTPEGDARLDILHEDGTWARCACSMSGCTVSCTLPSAALNGTGTCRAAHFVFTSGGRVESTEDFILEILPDVDCDGSESARDYDDALTKLSEKWGALNSTAEKAEAGRVEAEKARSNSEDARASAEHAREAAETRRVSSEAERGASERARVEAEAARAASEKRRENEENARNEAENARKRAETQRESAESERVSQQAKNNADQQQNNEAAKGLVYHICKHGEFQLDASGEHNVPNITGKLGVVYWTPIVKTDHEYNRFEEWAWVDGGWELKGETKHVSPATTGDIDKIAAGQTVSSTRVLDTTGLSYLWTKLKGAFAAIGHRHLISDVTDLDAALGDKATKAELASLRDSLSQTPWMDIYTAGGGQFIKYRKSGPIVTIAWSFKFESLTTWDHSIPEEIAPKGANIYVPAIIVYESASLANVSASAVIYQTGAIHFTCATANARHWHEGSVTYQVDA